MNVKKCGRVIAMQNAKISMALPRLFKNVLIGLVGGSLSACAPFVVDPHSTATVNKMLTPTETAIPCPPPHLLIERDLTVAWLQRRYHLANGQTCCPEPDATGAMCSGQHEASTEHPSIFPPQPAAP
jgi:hypothetical protein